jgi:hypothetical protein
VVHIAKKKSENNLYLLSIVAIVAVVGIVILILQSTPRAAFSLTEEDAVGYALSARGFACGDGTCQFMERIRGSCPEDCEVTEETITCADTDGGWNVEEQGTVSGTWKTTGEEQSWTDVCASESRIREGYCRDDGYAYYNTKNCEDEVGVGYVCEDGACVPESCDEDIQLDGDIVECASYVSSTGTFMFSQDDASAAVAGMYLFLDYTSEVYLAEGESTTDPSSGNTVTLSSIENDDYETIEFVAGSTAGEIRFSNNDGRYVQLPLAGDSSYTSGSASNEPIFWGHDAPSSTVANQDELVYLEGESCEGDTSVVDCQGALFLVIDSDANAHLVEINNVDTSDDEISFDDLTYGSENNNEEYTDGSETTIELDDAGEITLIIDESAMTIEFSSIGSSHGAEIETENGAILQLVNTDTTIQTFEGMTFTEYDDGVLSTYLTEFEIDAAYDDVTDNSIKLGLDSISALGTSEGFGLYDFSDAIDEDQVFMTYKGTLITYDREDQLSLIIEHPEETVYALIDVE